MDTHRLQRQSTECGRFRRLAVLPGALLPAAGLLTNSAWAQCAMCYQTAAASGAKGIHALNIGILALILPLASLIAGITVVTYRYRGSK